MATFILTSGGRSLIRDWLIGENPNPPSWIAVGTSTNPVGYFLTAVPGETFRASIVSTDADGPNAVFHGFLGLADNAGNVIGNIGLIGGDATGQAATGTLIAIGNVPSPFTKSAADTYQLDVTLTVSGTVN